MSRKWPITPITKRRSPQHGLPVAARPPLNSLTLSLSDRAGLDALEYYESSQSQSQDRPGRRLGSDGWRVVRHADRIALDLSRLHFEDDVVVIAVSFRGSWPKVFLKADVISVRTVRVLHEGEVLIVRVAPIDRRVGVVHVAVGGCVVVSAGVRVDPIVRPAPYNDRGLRSYVIVDDTIRRTEVP